MEIDTHDIIYVSNASLTSVFQNQSWEQHANKIFSRLFKGIIGSNKMEFADSKFLLISSM